MAETKAERRESWKKRTTKTATALRKAKATVTLTGKRSIPTTAQTPAEIRVAAFRAETPERVVVDPVTGKHTRIDTRTGAATVISGPAGGPREAVELSMQDHRTIDARRAAEMERASAGAAMVAAARARPPDITGPVQEITPDTTVSAQEIPPYTGTEYVPSPYQPGTYPEDIEYGERPKFDQPQIHDIIWEKTQEMKNILSTGFSMGMGGVPTADIEKQTLPLKTAEQVLFEQQYPAVSDVDTTPYAPHKLKSEYETVYDIGGDRMTAVEDPITEFLPSIEEISTAGAEFHKKYPGITGPVVSFAEDVLETVRKYDEPIVERQEALLDIQRQHLIGTAPDPSLKKPEDTFIPGPIEKAIMFAGGTAIGAYEGVREHPVKTAAMVGLGIVLPGATRAVTGVAGAVPVIGGILARYGVPVAMTGVTVHYGMDVINRVDAPVPSGKMKRVRITRQEYIDSYFKQYGTMPVLDPKQKYDFYIDVPTERVPTAFEKGKVFGEILGTEIIPMSVGIGAITKLGQIKTDAQVFETRPYDLIRDVGGAKKDYKGMYERMFDVYKTDPYRQKILSEIERIDIRIESAKTDANKLKLISEKNKLINKLRDLPLVKTTRVDEFEVLPHVNVRQKILSQIEKIDTKLSKAKTGPEKKKLLAQKNKQLELLMEATPSEVPHVSYKHPEIRTRREILSDIKNIDVRLKNAKTKKAKNKIRDEKNKLLEELARARLVGPKEKELIVDMFRVSEAKKPSELNILEKLSMAKGAEREKILSQIVGSDVLLKPTRAIIEHPVAGVLAKKNMLLKKLSKARTQAEREKILSQIEKLDVITKPLEVSLDPLIKTLSEKNKLLEQLSKAKTQAEREKILSLIKKVDASISKLDVSRARKELLDPMFLPSVKKPKARSRKRILAEVEKLDIQLSKAEKGVDKTRLLAKKNKLLDELRASKVRRRETDQFQKFIKDTTAEMEMFRVKEREIERVRERLIEKPEFEKKIEISKREKVKDVFGKERAKVAEKEMTKAMEKSKNIEKQIQKELERPRERVKERVKERVGVREIERTREREMERVKEREMERVKEREIERVKEREIERVKEREKERVKEREIERVREREKERVKEQIRVPKIRLYMPTPKTKIKPIKKDMMAAPGYAWQLANPIASLEQLLGVTSPKSKRTKSKRTNNRRTKR